MEYNALEIERFTVNNMRQQAVPYIEYTVQSNKGILTRIIRVIAYKSTGPTDRVMNSAS